MEFPITDLLSPSDSTQWILDHFHPQGLLCPNCGDPVAKAYIFRTTKKSQLTVYRCRECNTVYNLYTNTIFQQRHLTPQQVVLFLRGVLKGEASITIAAELQVSPQTILDLRRDVQDRARFLQPKTALTDEQTETDEMFQNAGEKKRATHRSVRSTTLSRQQPAWARYL
jgi:transposase-like protein